MAHSRDERQQNTFDTRALKPAKSDDPYHPIAQNKSYANSF
jgi:hypothetical protein